jgi:hypothetical protein
MGDHRAAAAAGDLDDPPEFVDRKGGSGFAVGTVAIVLPLSYASLLIGSSRYDTMAVLSARHFFPLHK